MSLYQLRDLPHNIGAEAAMLGGILADNRILDGIADIVQARDFFEPLHGRLFSAITAMVASGGNANPVSLQPFANADPGISSLGGAGYLAQLTGSGAAVVGAKDFARQVAMLAKHRRVVEGLTEAAAIANDTSETIGDFGAALDVADAALSEIFDQGDGVAQVSAYQAFSEVISDLDNSAIGIAPRNLPSFNQVAGDLRPHDLIVLGARPGMGKTALALSYAIGAAMDGHGVLFVTLEMSRAQLMERAIASVIFDGESGVPYKAIRDRTLTLNARRRVMDCATMFRDMSLNFIDAGSLTIGRLNMIVRRWKRRMEAKGTPLKLVVVDYLQLVNPDRFQSNITSNVSEVSRGLKGIAKTHDVAIMALAQLNRSVETRDDKRPKLSDLRESGQIEQDADAVVFLYRDYYYLQKAGPGTTGEDVWREALEMCKYDIEFICAKRRSGEEGTANGLFFGAFQSVRG